MHADPLMAQRRAGRCRRRAEKQSGGGSPALDKWRGGAGEAAVMWLLRHVLHWLLEIWHALILEAI